MSPTSEQIVAIREAIHPALRELVTFVAGTGVRQGECLGLTASRVDLNAREILIDRQLVSLPHVEPF